MYSNIIASKWTDHACSTRGCGRLAKPARGSLGVHGLLCRSRARAVSQCGWLAKDSVSDFFWSVWTISSSTAGIAKHTLSLPLSASPNRAQCERFLPPPLAPYQTCVQPTTMASPPPFTPEQLAWLQKKYAGTPPSTSSSASTSHGSPVPSSGSSSSSSPGECCTLLIL